MTLSKRAALLVLICMTLELGSAGYLRAQSSSPHGPAVVELYTSQGCSSCPPADALLGELRGCQDNSARSVSGTDKSVFHVPVDSFPGDATRVAVLPQRDQQGPIVGSATALLR
jgi:hypothetical protein